MPPTSSRKSTLNELCRKIITSVDDATQKIVQHNEPNFDRLRRGDFARSPAQVLEIENFLDDAQTRLAEFDLSISQLEDAFDRLKAARSAFEHSIDIAGTLIAPVHRLPEDVLVEIFLVYLSISVPKKVSEDNPLHNHYALSFAFYREGLYCPTLELSHVCTFWRKVTFSRPTLWASLSLQLDVATGYKRNSNLPSLLSHHLSRSSQHSLNLNLYGSKPGPRQTQAFNMLIDHCARWQCLSMDYVTDELWEQFLSRLQSVDQPLILLRLEVLCLPSSAHGMLVHAPNLKILQGKKLFLGSLQLSWEEFRKADFTKLKEIHHIRLRGASLGQFLARTPVLEECELELDDYTDIQDIFHISSLTTLSITLISRHSPETWQTLRTPNVTSLTLGSFFGLPLDGDDIKDKVEKVSAMLLQSGCTLRQISLKFAAAEFAICLLQSHPSVENLTLHALWNCLRNEADRSIFQTHFNDLFAGLTISEGSVPLAPNLRYLEIDYNDPHFTDGICNMIKSRAGVVDNSHSLPLKEVVIEFRGSSAREVYRHLCSRLASSVGLGLRLSLVEPDQNAHSSTEQFLFRNGDPDTDSEDG